MKKILTLLALSVSFIAAAQSLVLLHTNDTHSVIDSDEKGVGGILPRKAIIDSIKKAEKNVILIDAGDMVQGSLYFKYFKGDVEYPLANMLDYDIKILGNHELDNGVEELAKYWKGVKAARLSSNYDFTGSAAEGLFDPYLIRTVDDKKIGFLALNLDPAGLVSDRNAAGIKYNDILETANKTAALLKKKGCSLVVAVTHIGYDDKGQINDSILAQASRNIDIIIGGHSHTPLGPEAPNTHPYWIKNAAGRYVLVAQTGKYGMNLGYIKLDLNNFANKKIDYHLIPVTDRFPASAYSEEIQNFLAPYKHDVDSVNARVIGWSNKYMDNNQRTGAYPNWAGDFVAQYGRHIADSLRNAGRNIPPVAFGLMNVGGIRHSQKQGAVTEGHVQSTFPFYNEIVLIELQGDSIIKAMDSAARKGGEGVSSEVRVVTDANGNLKKMLVDGLEIDPDKKYLISTISYLAEGKDGLDSLSGNTEIWHDSEDISVRILQHIYSLTEAGLAIDPDPTPRFVKDISDLMQMQVSGGSENPSVSEK